MTANSVDVDKGIGHAMDRSMVSPEGLCDNRMAVAGDEPVLRFDADWFRATYPKLARIADEPGAPSLFDVYLSQARSLGVSPNAHFAEKHYRAVHRDVARSVEDGAFWCGFHHYLRHGHAERRQVRRPDVSVAVDLRRFAGPLSDPFQDAFVALWLRGMVRLVPEVEFLLLVDAAGVDAFAKLEGVNARRLPLQDVQWEMVRILRKRSVDCLLTPYASTDLTFPAYTNVLVADRPLGLSSLPAADRARTLREWRRFDTVLCQDDGVEREVRDMLGGDGVAVGRFPLAELARHGLALAAAGGESEALRQIAVAGLPGREQIRSLVKHLHDMQAADDGCEIVVVLLDAPEKVVRTFQGLAAKRGLRCRVEAIVSVRAGDLAAQLSRSGLIADFGSTWPESLDVLAAAVGVPVFRLSSEYGPEDDLVLPHGATRRPAVSPAGTSEARQVLSALTMARSSSAARATLYGVSSVDGSVEWLAVRVPPASTQRVLSLALKTPHAVDDRRVRLERWLNGELQDRVAVEPGAVLDLDVTLPADGGTLDWRLVSMDEGGKWQLVRLGSDRRMRCLHAFVRVGNQILLSGVTPAADAAADSEAAFDRANALIEAYEPLKREVSDQFVELVRAFPAMQLKVPASPFLSRLSRPRVLHVVKPSYLDPDLLFHGSTKDILGRRNYFMRRGFQVDELVVPPKEGREEKAIRTLMARRGVEYDVIFIEYLLYPELMEYFRDRYPAAKILVRGHNAEILHRIDTVYATWLTSEGRPLGDRLRALRIRKQLRTIRRYLDDERRCARLADHVVSISDWETRHYWPRMVGRDKTATVPYFVPSEIQRDYPPTRRQRRIVALSSVGPGPLVTHALQNFKKLVKASAARLPEWTFAATGELAAEDVIGHPQINFVGTVRDPIDELRGAAAMALLSPLGYGFKTKIMDAVTAHAYTLLPAGLLKRVPPELHPYCIAVDPGSPASFMAGAQKAMADWPGGDPNEQLRRRAFEAMDKLLGIDSALGLEP